MFAVQSLLMISSKFVGNIVSKDLYNVDTAFLCDVSFFSYTIFS